MNIDLNAAVEAVEEYMELRGWDRGDPIDIPAFLQVALPHIEQAVREQVAREIEAAEPPTNPNPRYRETYILTYPQAAAIARGKQQTAEDSHLWPCGCLINRADAHRVGCPDHPEGKSWRVDRLGLDGCTST